MLRLVPVLVLGAGCAMAVGPDTPRDAAAQTDARTDARTDAAGVDVGTTNVTGDDAGAELCDPANVMAAPPDLAGGACVRVCIVYEGRMTGDVISVEQWDAERRTALHSLVPLELSRVPRQLHITCMPRSPSVTFTTWLDVGRRFPGTCPVSTPACSPAPSDPSGTATVTPRQGYIVPVTIVLRDP